MSGASLVRFLRRRPVLVLTVLLSAHVAAALALMPACLSIDEVTHLWMIEGLLKTASLTVANGYDLLPSRELESMAIRGVNGRLVAAYPYGYPLLALPLYALVGARAFFVLNAAAFVGTTVLCHAIARRVLGSARAALAAAAIFGAATYAWDYALAAWPHASATFLTTAAFHQALVASSASPGLRGAARWVFAGLVAGVAVTLRLDAVFMVAPLLLLAAVQARSPLAPTTCILLGAIPPLTLLAAVNRARFGEWSPFSYGPWETAGSPTSGLAAYASLGAIAVVALIACAAWGRVPRATSRAGLALVGLSLLLALFIPRAREVLDETLRGARALLVDLRHSDPTVAEPALARTADGAMVYAGTLKKAWLQSLPYAPLAVAAPWLARARTDARGTRLLFVLAAAVATPVAVFCRFRWHGGLCFNLRYLLPALPFLAILTAETLRRLAARAPSRWRLLRGADVLTLLAALAYLVGMVVLRPHVAITPMSERFYLDAPLVLAAATAALAVLAVVGRSSGVGRTAAGAAFVVGVCGLVWATMTTLTYDAPASRALRGHSATVLASVRPFIAPGTLVVADVVDPLAGMLGEGVILADGGRDDFEDVSRLVEAASCAGRAARAVVRRQSLATISQVGEGRIRVSVLHDGGEVVVAALTASGACGR